MPLCQKQQAKIVLLTYHTKHSLKCTAGESTFQNYAMYNPFQCVTEIQNSTGRKGGRGETDNRYLQSATM